MFVLLHISDSDKHFAPAINEYVLRLGKQLFLDPLPPFKDSNPQLVIQKETEALIARIKKKYPHHKKILLLKEGNLLTTEELNTIIAHQEVIFIIGGPYGVAREQFKKHFPNLQELSFGAITLPHGLAKLVLIEQLYRCRTIETGKKYHY